MAAWMVWIARLTPLGELMDSWIGSNMSWNLWEQRVKQYFAATLTKTSPRAKGRGLSGSGLAAAKRRKAAAMGIKLIVDAKLDEEYDSH